MSSKWERFRTTEVRPPPEADVTSAAQTLQDQTNEIHKKIRTSLVVRTDLTSPVGLATQKVDRDLSRLSVKLKNITAEGPESHVEQEMSDEETQRNVNAPR